MIMLSAMDSIGTTSTGNLKTFSATMLNAFDQWRTSERRDKPFVPSKHTVTLSPDGPLLFEQLVGLSTGFARAETDLPVVGQWILTRLMDMESANTWFGPARGTTLHRAMERDALDRLGASLVHPQQTLGTSAPSSREHAIMVHPSTMFHANNRSATPAFSTNLLSVLVQDDDLEAFLNVLPLQGSVQTHAERLMGKAPTMEHGFGLANTFTRMLERAAEAKGPNDEGWATKIDVLLPLSLSVLGAKEDPEGTAEVLASWANGLQKLSNRGSLVKPRADLIKVTSVDDLKAMYAQFEGWEGMAQSLIDTVRTVGFRHEAKDLMGKSRLFVSATATKTMNKLVKPAKKSVDENVPMPVKPARAYRENSAPAEHSFATFSPIPQTKAAFSERLANVSKPVNDRSKGKVREMAKNTPQRSWVNAQDAAPMNLPKVSPVGWLTGMNLSPIDVESPITPSPAIPQKGQRLVDVLQTADKSVLDNLDASSGWNAWTEALRKHPARDVQASLTDIVVARRFWKALVRNDDGLVSAHEVTDRWMGIMGENGIEGVNPLHMALGKRPDPAWKHVWASIVVAALSVREPKERETWCEVLDIAGRHGAPWKVLLPHSSHERGRHALFQLQEAGFPADRLKTWEHQMAQQNGTPIARAQQVRAVRNFGGASAFSSQVRLDDVLGLATHDRSLSDDDSGWDHDVDQMGRDEKIDRPAPKPYKTPRR